MSAGPVSGNIPTLALYFDQPQKFEETSIVLSVKEVFVKKTKYFGVQLDRSIFHPQGGGQLSDIGTINGKNVDFVHKEEGSRRDQFTIFHCFKDPIDFKVGDSVHLQVDKDNRFLNSRWHTAAHVVGHLVEQNFPNCKAFGGNCFPGDAYMKFSVSDGAFPDTKDLIEKVEKSFKVLILDNPPLVILKDGENRRLQIGSYEPVGCGGTHIESLKDLRELTILGCKCNSKEKTLTVKYKLS